MKKMLVIVGASIIAASCASSRGMQVANVTSCDVMYAQLLEKYSAIHSEYQDNVAPALNSLTDLEAEVLSTLRNCPREQPRLLALLANINTTLGEDEKALGHARLAEGLDPGIWETNAALGDVLTLFGDYETGLVYLEKASRLAPKNIILRSNLCANYEMAKLYQQAVSVCTEVIESGERKVLGPALYVRARAYKAMGQTDSAETDFNRSRAEGFDGSKWYSTEHLEGEKTK